MHHKSTDTIPPAAVRRGTDASGAAFRSVEWGTGYMHAFCSGPDLVCLFLHGPRGARGGYRVTVPLTHVQAVCEALQAAARERMDAGGA